MTYLNDWKLLKTNFEKATKMKKPVEKFLGLFRKSTGIEKALTAVDAAVKKQSFNDLKAAYKDFMSVSMKYSGQLNAEVVKILNDKNLTDEKLKYQTATFNLMTGLDSFQRLIKKDLDNTQSKGELDATIFSLDWNAAKKRFEQVTGKKKPSDYVLGVFRKSTGLEKVLTAIDAATQKNDPKAAKAALLKFGPVAKDYITKLEKSVKGTDEAADYDQAIDALGTNLKTIGTRVDDYLKVLG